METIGMMDNKYNKLLHLDNELCEATGLGLRVYRV